MQSIRLVMLGEESVGKTSILYVETQGNRPANTSPTVLVEFSSMKYMHEGRSIHLQIWDTVGQEKYRGVTKSYYRGVHGVMLVYDVTNRDTFLSLDRWLQDIRDSTSQPTLPILICANKTDLPSRQVSTEEGRSYAHVHSLLYAETSITSIPSIKAAYSQLIENILNRPIEDDKISRDSQSLYRPSGGGDGKGNRGCCWGKKGKGGRESVGG